MTRLTLSSLISRWSRKSTPRGREIVLEVLKSAYPASLRAQDLYDRIRKEYPDEKAAVPFSHPVPEPLVSRFSSLNPKKKKEKPKVEPPHPPYPEHPIRSFKYLKSIILEELAQSRLIRKVHSMREPTPEELAQKNLRSAAKKKKGKKAAVPMVLINSKGMVDQWSWMLETPESIEERKAERLRIKKAIAGQKTLDPKKVEEAKRKEFEAEWGHLNVRRRRARQGKLEREDKWARLLESGRQQGRAESEQRAA